MNLTWLKAFFKKLPLAEDGKKNGLTWDILQQRRKSKNRLLKQEAGERNEEEKHFHDAELGENRKPQIARDCESERKALWQAAQGSDGISVGLAQRFKIKSLPPPFRTEQG